LGFGGWEWAALPQQMNVGSVIGTEIAAKLQQAAWL
jgi:hypothetical protein